MRRVRDWLVAGIVLLLARRRSKEPPTPRHPRIVPEGTPSPTAEKLVLVLLALSSTCSAGFVAVYAVEAIPAKTQYLGLSLGLALLFAAAALILTGRRLVVTEELEHDYPAREHPREQELVAELVDESGDQLTRRRLVKLGLAGAGGALAVALVTPAVSLGPLLETRIYRDTPWRPGRRLVDEEGRPWRADRIEEGNLYTAFPEGADREAFGSPVILLRLHAAELRLPTGLQGFDAHGIVAYSKICTHAGCAVAIYRTPLFRPTDPRPALVCPCHYSTFDPVTGGTVLYGPAGRPLPMLPIAVGSEGDLRARGNFSGQVGPAWWGTRIWKPSA